MRNRSSAKAGQSMGRGSERPTAGARSTVAVQHQPRKMAAGQPPRGVATSGRGRRRNEASSQTKPRQRSMKQARRVAGSLAPRPGRSPPGARKSERNAASSSIPSDWYPEKSCAAATKARKQIPATAMLARGARLKTSSSDASAPSSTTAISALSEEASQKSDGAYQSDLSGPNASRSSPRYSPAGRIPRG